MADKKTDMPVPAPRDLMATTMDGGIPDRIAYSLMAPQAFWRELSDDLGRPSDEVYRLDNGDRRVALRTRGKPPWDLPWDEPPENEEEEALLRQRFSRYLTGEKIPGLRVSEYGSITVPGSLYHLRRMIYPLQGDSSMFDNNILYLSLRSQSLHQSDGYNIWETTTTPVTWAANETALLLCDVWDRHWCRGAVERLDAMVDRMNEVTGACRNRGIQIIHAPSGTMDVYADTPARQRMIEAPAVEPPPEIDHDDPPLPVDASDDGSDTGETRIYQAWRRQHPAIEIDQERDGISDNGCEVYNLFRQKGINHLLIMGVHTNMCILGRSFAIKQMVRWGVSVALIRDMTDAMYNPARPPYVSHKEGTRLVIEYIEKFWCPTVGSEEL